MRKSVLVVLFFSALFVLILGFIALVFDKEITGYSISGSVLNTMNLKNDDSSAFINYPVQFGRVFVQGEVPSGFYPQVVISGSAVQTQVDIKNRWPDNSLKFAVISFILTQLNSGENKTITFQNIDSTTYQSTVGNNSLSNANMLSNFNFDAVMELVNPAQTHTISARTMLSNGSIDKTWLSGPIVTSVILADHSVARQYDLGWEQQGTVLTRCTSSTGVLNPTIYECSPLNTLYVQDASWVNVSQILNLNDELVFVQSVNTAQNIITVQRDYGGLPHETSISIGNFVTSNTWQPTTQANRKSFRPIFEADFWPALNKVRVRFIGENSNTEALQDLYYDLNLKTGYSSPTTVLSETAITHHYGARWARDFWIGGAPSKKLTIDYNKDYLAQTGFIDYYDAAVQPVPNTVSSWYNCFSAGTSCSLVSLTNSGCGIFEKCINTYADMGPGGGRWELGRLPKTHALWMNNMDWRMQEVVLGMTDRAAVWPTHFREGDPTKVFNRDANTGAVPTSGSANAVSALGKPINPNSRPSIALSTPLWDGTTNSDKLNLVSRFTHGEANNALANGVTQGWGISLGHYYNFFTEPYLLTGDYFYYEELLFWASYSVIGDSNARGPIAGNLVGQGGGLTSPWGERYQCRPDYVRVPAAALAVDGTPEKENINNLLLDSFITWMGIQNIPLSQEQNISSTSWNMGMWNFGRQQFTNPGNNFGNPDLPSPLNFWIYGSGCGIYPVVTGSSEPDFCAVPWMYATCVESIGKAQELGYPVNSLMNFISDYYSWHFNTPGFNPVLIGASREASTDNNGVALATPQQVLSYYEGTYQTDPCTQPGLPSFCTGIVSESYFSYHLAATSRLYQYDQTPYSWMRASSGASSAYSGVTFDNDPRFALAPRPLSSGPSAVPNSPTNLQSNNATVTLTWTDTSSDESGFYIERQLNTAGFTPIATVGVNVQQYVDSSAAASTTYSYRVYAYNSQGVSEYSNIIYMATPAPVCGNGVLQTGESCDDGDIISGDGCSATCTVESGYTCTTASPSVCSVSGSSSGGSSPSGGSASGGSSGGSSGGNSGGVTGSAISGGELENNESEPSINNSNITGNGQNSISGRAVDGFDNLRELSPAFIYIALAVLIGFVLFKIARNLMGKE